VRVVVLTVHQFWADKPQLTARVIICTLRRRVCEE
jgi:hypothetical protein